MSKLRAISDAVAARVAGITLANGYSSDAGRRLVRGESRISPDEVPAARVFLQRRFTENEIGESARQTVTVVVELYVPFVSDPELVAIAALDDVARAVERRDDTQLGGVLRGPLSWESDEIIYPESDERIVGARVTYNAPHVRRYGKPD